MSGREKKKKSWWHLNTIFCLLRMGCDRVDDLRPCPAVRKIMPHALDQQQFGARYCRSGLFSALHRYQGIIRPVNNQDRRLDYP